MSMSTVSHFFIFVRGTLDPKVGSDVACWDCFSGSRNSHVLFRLNAIAVSKMDFVF